MMTAAHILRESGLKVTPQRIAILKALMSTSAHPTAEDIYLSLKAENPSMSLATVYKALDAFTEHGLVRSLSVGGESLHYDAKTAFHPHFVCEKCGAVYDIDADISGEMEQISEKVGNLTGRLSGNKQLFFYGICEKCL